MSEQTALAVLEEVQEAEIIDPPAVTLQPDRFLVRPVAPSAAIVQAMREYEAVKVAITTPDDYQRARDGREYPKKSFFVKMSTAFGFSSEPIEERIDHDENGRIIGAKVTMRVETPGNTRHAIASAYCSIDEPRFTDLQGRPIPGSRQKLRHDLPATASTRAFNIACGRLLPAGSAVSWEEVDAGGEYHSLEQTSETRQQQPRAAQPAQRKAQGPSAGNGNGAEFDALTAMAEKIAANHGTVAKAIFGLAYGELRITGKVAGQLAALSQDELGQLRGWLENRLTEANGAAPADVGENEQRASTPTQHATIRKLASELGKKIPDDESLHAMTYDQAAEQIVELGKEKKGGN